MKTQVTNPYLPLYEYVPDGEPHLFNGRVYIYGSHDVPQGTKYCENHYTVWSAPEEDLSDWRCEGVSYRRTQDPSNAQDTMQLWAPDVTCGPDGRYYLYYCFSFYPEIGVAVADDPAGPFEFYGHVHYPAHIKDGAVLSDFMPFDPAVLTDDDGRVYLYYGFAPGGEKGMLLPPEVIEAMSPEDREGYLKMKDSMSKGAMCVELEPDMLTVKGIPEMLIPGEGLSEGTSFEGHGFFEASSIRKFGDTYYFVYSSHKSHELCYAASSRPDGGYTYGGTIVSNGDIGLNGRVTPVYTLGNNHGGIVCAAGQYYIFYHRQTNGTEYSRQGCAQKIEILPDGRIPQAEITSCGLNDGPLAASGVYPAAIACHLTDPTTTDYIDYHDQARMQQQIRVTEQCHVQYITDIKAGAVVGYKYFDLSIPRTLSLEVRGGFEGTVTVAADPNGIRVFDTAIINVSEDVWQVMAAASFAGDEEQAVYLIFAGEGRLELKSLIWS